MIKIAIILGAIVSVLCAEISHVTLDKKDFKPSIEPEMVETHEVLKKQSQPGLENRPVFRAEEHRNEGRARIEPVRPKAPIALHDMLADEPVSGTPNEVTRNDNFEIPHYAYNGPVEVAYPDIPYAPGYNYGAAYTSPDRYDVYGSNPNDYLAEPTALGLIWSQVPDARTLVNVAGRTIGWILNSIFVIMMGSLLTVGFCTYTNLCQITFNGVGPIHEEMRSLITPERLEKIGHAADFVKTAIDKYQKIQTTNVGDGLRKRRSIFF